MRYIIILVAVLMLSACTGNRAAEKDGQGSGLSAKMDKVEIPEDITIAEACTELLDDSPSRVSNINLACGAINGLVLSPGGRFSFNDTVGRRTEANGYKDAPVLVDGHKEQGCGGGVCQVSSTLYMAALQAGLQIDERHKHSESVSYAPDGNDATVVYGQKDMAFTNSTDKPITLSVWTDGKYVFSSITQKSS